MHKSDPVKLWTISSVPATEDGAGFTVGASFHPLEFSGTLYLGYWPIGMQFTHKERCYTVEGRNRVRRDDGKVYQYGVNNGQRSRYTLLETTPAGTEETRA